MRIEASSMTNPSVGHIATALSGPNVISVTSAPSFEAVRDTLATLMSDSCLQDRGADQLMSLELVLAEALNNVVEHALAGECEDDIQLSVAILPDCLRCQIIDQGDPMPNGQLPAGLARPLDELRDTLPEGGFGWNLIRTLTENLSYQRQDGRNILSFDLSGGPLPRA